MRDNWLPICIIGIAVIISIYVTSRGDDVIVDKVRSLEQRIVQLEAKMTPATDER